MLTLYTRLFVRYVDDMWTQKKVISFFFLTYLWICAHTDQGIPHLRPMEYMEINYKNAFRIMTYVCENRTYNQRNTERQPTKWWIWNEIHGGAVAGSLET